MLLLFLLSVGFCVMGHLLFGHVIAGYATPFAAAKSMGVMVLEASGNFEELEQASGEAAALMCAVVVAWGGSGDQAYARVNRSQTSHPDHFLFGRSILGRTSWFLFSPARAPHRIAHRVRFGV
jgi:hypothetical protein